MILCIIGLQGKPSQPDKQENLHLACTIRWLSYFNADQASYSYQTSQQSLTESLCAHKYEDKGSWIQKDRTRTQNTVGVKKNMLRLRPILFYCPFHPVPFRFSSVFSRVPFHSVLFYLVPSVSARLIQDTLG